MHGNSRIRMKIWEPKVANGRKTSRSLSKSTCNRLDSAKEIAMVLAAALVLSSVLIKGSFSRMLPLASARAVSSCFSNSASSTFKCSSFCNNSLLRCSNSGFSCCKVAPNSCPSSPARVTEKLTLVTKQAAFGGSCSIALEFRVQRYMQKPSLKSHILSPIWTTCLGPCRTRSRRSKGKRKLSMPSTSCTMMVLPKRTESSSWETSLASCAKTVSAFCACCFNQATAWLFGSTMNGTMLPYLIITAFSCDSRSADRPCAFQVRSSLSLDMTLRKSNESRPFFCVQRLFEWAR
mmetsp:Transcript_110736/g.352737  ORF Transcript_110736/g.352737 Transcript_110736/m.352737 type:complete len:292 (-) Transcript_110736:4488-5363(-)